ncbi:very short patch repair endonuclease [Actinocatenispora rupis]|uniref:very short patch repair endonuclease n=1 Tax=Actinocatenispora rupis TaxID=519421 RepID=UPI0019405372
MTMSGIEDDKVQAHRRPGPSSDGVSDRMRLQSTQNTSVELRVRRLLHARGYRYRVHLRVPGYSRRTMDIGFPRMRLAVFLDGCFWHSCPIHGQVPRNNDAWWRSKFDRNSSRDLETTHHLADIGWSVLRFWEHEPTAEIVSQISDEVDALKRVRTA